MRTAFDFKEGFAQLFLIDTAQVGHVFLTFVVTVDAAYLALHSLFEQPIQQTATMVTERRRLEIVGLETMRYVDFETFFQVNSVFCVLS